MLATALLLLAGAFAFAQYPERPSPPKLVNDFAQLLDAGEAQQLETKLVAYDDSTSTQISIVIVPTLDGHDKAEYATELGEKWGIGRSKEDNGVLVLVAKEERQTFIATGRGVEEFLTDLACKRIVEDIMIPNFKEGKYYDGLNLATDNMIARLEGQFKGTDEKPGPPIWVIALIILIIFFVLPLIFGRRGRGTTYGGRGYGGMGPFWGTGGGGFSGGGGGGGFGGFGGGSFGGGGAGGSW